MLRPTVPEIDVPETFDPNDASRWTALALGARDRESLAIALPAEPPAVALVLVASVVDTRRSSGLTTRLLVRGSATSAEHHVVPEQALTDLDTVRTTADALAAHVARRDATRSAPRAEHVRRILEELGANVVDHSLRAETGFAAASVDRASRRFQLAVADSGIGILASLRRSPEHATRLDGDGDSFELALERGVTSSSNPSRNMGMGLAIVRELADELDADLWIASGGALVHRRTVGGARASTVRSISPWRGTWIGFDAPLGLAA